ncbi:MAG: DUF192 domain-containing protein [Candidatus Saccharimonadales bacterium]
MKKWWLGASILLAISLGGLVWLGWMITRPAVVQLGDTEFTTRVARTAVERTQGLSGTSSLAAHEALLFIFPSDDYWEIWMKGMHYPIDIVWLDTHKKVIHIVRDAQPRDYPAVIYKPNQRARYVIELAAGAVDRNRITIGSQAIFDSMKGTFE